jgi:4a-hydroxytetrahydrobiopterin dehydratase
LDKKISKSYEFKTYLDGIDFVQKVASLAENQNHHPHIIIEWCKVQISIHSHQMNGVTTKCVNLATGINLILE